MESAASPGAFSRCSAHARDLRGVGGAVLRNDGARAADRQMVGPVYRPDAGGLFSAACLDYDFAADADLFSAVAFVFATAALEQVLRRTAARSRPRVALGDGSSVSGD